MISPRHFRLSDLTPSPVSLAELSGVKRVASIDRLIDRVKSVQRVGP
jgi:hypothetical protein